MPLGEKRKYLCFIPITTLDLVARNGVRVIHAAYIDHRGAAIERGINRGWLRVNPTFINGAGIHDQIDRIGQCNPNRVPGLWLNAQALDQIARIDGHQLDPSNTSINAIDALSTSKLLKVP